MSDRDELEALLVDFVGVDEASGYTKQIMEILKKQ